MHRTVGDVLVALLCTRQFHPMRASHKPAIHHRVCDLGMELQRIAGAMAKCLHGESVALSQQLTAGRKVETFAMPLIDMVRPLLTDLEPSLGRADRVIADFSVAVRVWKNTGAEMSRQHLRAKTNTKIWLLVAKRDLNPVDLAPNKLFIVVGALRAAEDGRAGVIVHRFRQGIPETRTTDVKRIAQFRQSLPDAARRRMLLVKDK